MRISILVLVFCALTIAITSQSVQADGATVVEVFSAVDKGDIHLAGVDMFVARPIKGKLGMSAFALVVPGWAQVYAGPTYAPKDWLVLGVSGGVEQVANGNLGLRFATSAWAGYKKFSLLAIGEFNPDSFTGDTSGVWFDLTPRYQAAPWLTLGAKWRRGVGAGPLVELALPTKPSGTIWFSWMPGEPERLIGHGGRMLLGVQGSF